MIRNFALVFISAALLLHSTVIAASQQQQLELKNWQMYSSAAPNERFPFTAPGTVLGNLYNESLLLGFGMKNIQKEAPRFSVPWVFETEVKVPSPSPPPQPQHQQLRQQHHLLRFEGINYAGNLTVNGQLVASEADKTFVGTMRELSFDVTHLVSQEQASSTLHISVSLRRAKDSAFPPTNTDTDLSWTFIDWAPADPANYLGLWHRVFLISSAAAPSGGCRSAGQVRFPVVDLKLPPKEKMRLRRLPASKATAITGATAGMSLLWQLSNIEARMPPRGPFSFKCTLQLPASGRTVTVAAKSIIFKADADARPTDMTVDLPTVPLPPLVRDDLWWPWQMQTEKQFINVSDDANFGHNESKKKFFASLAQLQCGLYAEEEGSTAPCATLEQSVGLRQVESKVISAVAPAAGTAGDDDAHDDVGRTTPRPDDVSAFQFYVNGLPHMVRGAGWSMDLLLHRQNRQHWERTLLLLRAMGMNTLRQEGQFALPEFYSLADRYGIAIIPGFSCCDAWQHWSRWRQEQFFIANESLRFLVRSYRASASVIGFFRSSDQQPPPEVEQMYLKTLREERWPNPSLSSASATASPISGPSGVKMSGPYSYVPPNYFDVGAQRFLLGGQANPLPGVNGGGFGFLSEGGPGESPSLFESNLLFAKNNSAAIVNPPQSEMVNFHTANPVGLFYNLRFYTPPFAARFGTSLLLRHSAKNWFDVAQLNNFETMQSYVDSYSRARVTSSSFSSFSSSSKRAVASGFIQWMLGTLWPSNMWSTVDYFYTWTGNAAAFAQATGGFGAAPVVGILRFYVDVNKFSVAVSNNDVSREFDVSVRITTLVVDYEKFPARLIPVGCSERTVDGALAPNAVLEEFITPENFPAADPVKNQARPVTIINVETTMSATTSSRMTTTSQRIYWVSNIRRDVSNFSAANFYRTPAETLADLQGLTPLLLETPVSGLRGVDVAACFVGDDDVVQVQVSVPKLSETFWALLLRIDIVVAATETMQPVRPVLWQGQRSNLISILPSSGCTSTSTSTSGNNTVTERVRLLDFQGDRSKLLVKLRNETFPIKSSCV